MIREHGLDGMKVAGLHQQRDLEKESLNVTIPIIHAPLYAHGVPVAAAAKSLPLQPVSGDRVFNALSGIIEDSSAQITRGRNGQDS